MSLIKCIECGKEISEFSETCPNCGCPTSMSKDKSGENIKLTDQICPCCKVNKHILKDGLDTCSVCGYIFDDRYKDDPFGTRHKKSQQKSASQPHCPTCGSTNIQKISLTKKAAGAGLFGIFSKTARSQFECKDCGYKW